MYEYWFSQVRRQDRNEVFSGRWGQWRCRDHQWHREFAERVLVQGLLFMALVSLVGIF